jgi:Protein of unknown function (DUF1588)/Protein of unknown function (DUF1592)/Protein of unknown function (DUF1585)/Protein of unknown function (DUF1595)
MTKTQIPRFGRAQSALWLPLAAASMLACSGSIDSGAGGRDNLGGDGSPNNNGGGDGTGPGSGTGGGNGTGPGVGLESPLPENFTGAASALRRLSRDEMIASMNFLVGSAADRVALPEEQRPDHGALHTTGTSYDPTEVPKLRQAVIEFAVKAAPGLLTKSGCNKTAQAQKDCLQTWTVDLAKRAFRRIVTAAEQTRLKALTDLAGTAENDKLVVEGVLTTIFFAPSFLYRTENGTGSGAERKLTPNELASRLSFLATLAPPDAELTAAATAGSLDSPGERVKHFDRLAATDRGKKATTIWVMEWLAANESKVTLKSAKYKEGLPTDFASSIRGSADNAILRALQGSDEPTLERLFDTTDYAKDPAVDQIIRTAGTGLNAVGDIPAVERTGLLLHPYVLSAHTKEDGASPFQMGVFIRQNVLCEPIAAAPAGAVASAKNDVPAGSSQRESFEYRTSAGICKSCHAQFAPIGFAFLPYDPMGRWTRQDPSGKPWDLAGTSELSSGEVLEFDSPTTLAKALARDEQTHACLAQTLLSWTLGRKLIEQDRPALNDAIAVGMKSGGNTAAILRQIVSSPGFSTTFAAR